VTKPSPRLQRRVLADFGPDADHVLEQLGHIPEGTALAGRQDPERLQAACVLPVRGDTHEFASRVRLLNQDWRDALVAAGLAQPDWPRRLDAELGSS
jgi:hypothetical protein